MAVEWGSPGAFCAKLCAVVGPRENAAILARRPHPQSYALASYSSLIYSWFVLIMHQEVSMEDTRIGATVNHSVRASKAGFLAHG